MKFANRVKVNSATTGTGNMTLGTAVAGFRTFLSAALNTNLANDTTYLIENGTAEIEWGVGQVSTDGLTLQRLVVFGNSLNTTAKINFTGPTVISAPPLSELGVCVNHQSAAQLADARGNDAVAAGPFSHANGHRGAAYGYACNATGADSVALGSDNVADNTAGVAIGRAARAGTNCIAIGDGVTTGNGSSGIRNVAIGTATVLGVTKSHNVAIGEECYSNVDDAITLGRYARANQSGDFAVAMDSIGSYQNPAYQAVNHHWTTMATADATPANLTRPYSIEARTTNVFDIHVGYMERGGTYRAGGFKITGVIKRNNSGTTSFVGTPTVTTLGNDIGTAAAAVVTASNLLEIQVTGLAATSIRWCADARISRLFSDV